MLPGFRFLFTAIVLSMSILIFGLGAAALLRAAHEEFANLPARRAPPQPMFARQNDDEPPTLALLRIDTPVTDKSSENPPAPDATTDVPASAGQPPDTAPAETEKLAALKAAEPVQAEAARPEEPAKEASAETPSTPLSAAVTEPPAANADVKVAAIAASGEPAAAPPPATAPESAADIPSFESSIATTLIATLGGPAVLIDEATTAVKPDRDAAQKRAAQRARERRRVIAARRARLAREAEWTLQQQQPNPFIQTPFAQTPFAQGPVARTTR
jgi:hypothetical protein